jgi:L-cysteine desulfidase
MKQDHHVWNSYAALLRREVAPALGCTEPIAVALAAARAAAQLGKTPKLIEANLSRNILKNGMSVGIPGTGLYGLEIAAAVGAVAGDYKKGLEVLSGISAEALTRAKELCAGGSVKIKQRQSPYNLYIEVRVSNGQDTSTVIIQHEHTNIAYVGHNGMVILDRRQDDNESGVGAANGIDKGLTEKAIWDFAMNVPLEKIAFLMETARLNTAVSEKGLQDAYGLEVGRSLEDDIKNGLIADDILNRAVKRTAGAIDARMAGCLLPVMSNSGSGNQGITATMPIVSMAKDLELDQEHLNRALALSHLTTIHMKSSLGRLSALCGATLAATGAACGFVYLLGGGYPEVERAIQNMAGNVAGIICDGAKSSCALKVASSVHAAGQAALLAMKGRSVSSIEGIVAGNVEQTIQNIGRLGSVGMKETDKLILEMMLDKNE